MAKDIHPFASDIDLRVRCAEIAAAWSSAHDDVPARAKRLYDFVTGADEQGPLERILEALADANVN